MEKYFINNNKTTPQFPIFSTFFNNIFNNFFVFKSLGKSYDNTCHDLLVVNLCKINQVWGDGSVNKAFDGQARNEHMTLDPRTHVEARHCDPSALGVRGWWRQETCPQAHGSAWLAYAEVSTIDNHTRSCHKQGGMGLCSSKILSLQICAI